MKKFFLALALVSMTSLLFAGCLPVEEEEAPADEEVPAVDEVLEPEVEEPAAEEEATDEEPATEEVAE